MARHGNWTPAPVADAILNGLLDGAAHAEDPAADLVLQVKLAPAGRWVGRRAVRCCMRRELAGAGVCWRVLSGDGGVLGGRDYLDPLRALDGEDLFDDLGKVLLEPRGWVEGATGREGVLIKREPYILADQLVHKAAQEGGHRVLYEVDLDAAPSDWVGPFVSTLGDVEILVDEVCFVGLVSGITSD